MANDVGLNISLDTDDAQESAEGLSASMGSLTASFIRMSGIIAGFSLANVVVGQFQASIQAAVDFESQMADVQKVTNEFTAEKLSGSIRQLASDIPLAREELAKITEQAGRLGIQGTESIEQFTTTISKLSVATNISAEEAANSFARIVAVTDATIDDMNKIGSIVNELSNTMATAADEIVQGMLRSSAAASRFGLSAGEISAVAATINEVSATARRANTRTRRLFQGLQEPKKIKDVADAFSDLSERGFKQLIKNDPSEALRRVITLFRRGGRSADQLTKAFGTAERQALAGLSQNVEGLDQALETMNEQQEEATSLQREFEIQAGTTASRAQILSNRYNNLQTALGQELLPALNVTIQTLGQWTQELNRAASGTSKFTRKLETAVGTDALDGLQKNLDRSNDSLLSFDTKMVGITSTLATGAVAIGSFATGIGAIPALALTAGSAITGFASTVQRGRQETQKLNERLKALFSNINREGRGQAFFRSLRDNIESFSKQVNSAKFKDSTLENFIKTTTSFAEAFKKQEGTSLQRAREEFPEPAFQEKINQTLSDFELSDLDTGELETLGEFLENKTERELDEYVKNTNVVDRIVGGLSPRFKTALKNVGQITQTEIGNQSDELSQTLNKRLSEVFSVDQLRNITPLKRQELFDQVIGDLSAEQLRGKNAPSTIATNYVKALRKELKEKGETIFSRGFFLSEQEVIENQIDQIQKALNTKKLSLPEDISEGQAKDTIKRLRKELDKLKNSGDKASQSLQNVGKGLKQDIANQMRPTLEQFQEFDAGVLFDPFADPEKQRQLLRQVREDVKDAGDGFTQFQKNVQRASEGAARSFEDTFVKAMQGGFDDVEDALKSFGRSFVRELQRIVASNAAQQLFGVEEGEGGGLNFTGLISGGISSLMGDFFSVGDALVKENGDVVNFDDRDNLLAFRNNGPLMENKNGNDSSGNVTVDQTVENNFPVVSDQKIDRRIQKAAPRIAEQAKRETLNALRGGGSEGQVARNA